MLTELRKSGINILGDISWGSHFCQFYETKDDLLELLIPFFKAGLENNEYCIWIVCDPIPEEEAYKALQQSIPDFQKHVEKKNIEIFSCEDWYTQSGKFDSKTVIRTAVQKLETALKKGYDGVRMNGNETWLGKDDWSDFMKYEAEINDVLRNTRIIVLCTYPLQTSDGGALLDVAHAHECVVTRRKGKWEILEEPEIKSIKAELQRKSEELEQRVAERTNQLTQVVEQLKLEVEERKKAEERIKRQIELTTEIIHTIPTMIWCILPDGKLDFVNQPWMEYTGLSLVEAREAPTSIVHRDDLPRAMKKWELNRDVGNYYEDEMRLRAADNRYRWFLVRTAPLKDKDGKIIKWYGVSTDIEERKKTEEKLRQSESLLMEAEHLAHVGSWSLDLSNKTVTWSDELYEIFGVDPLKFDNTIETVIGCTHPADKNFIVEVVKEAVATHKPNNFHYRMIRPQGEERILHVRLAVMTDEQDSPVRIYGAVQDVTERKKAEDELRLAYQRLSYHVENTPLAVIEWDKDLNIARWSEEAEKIFGWKAAEVLGKNIYDEDFKLIYEQDAHYVNRIANDLTKGLVERNHSLNRNNRKDGNVIYSEWYNSVLRDDQGNVITVLSLAQDITERKVAEEKLNASYKQIRSLSEHLRNIREEERKHVAREIHDELGQELTVLKMDVGSLIKKIPQPDDIMRKRLASFSELVDNIAQSVRRISSELRPSLLDDLGLPAAISWHLEEFGKRSSIKTRFTEPKEEWVLPDAVKTNLFRILQEALTNVVRHSKATEVRVKLERDDHTITLHIFDNGVGYSTERSQNGNTLGILGMRERANIIGGKLEIETMPGNGTKIVVTVPV
jgi:PAS domain S-box-containing protein